MIKFLKRLDNASGGKVFLLIFLSIFLSVSVFGNLGNPNFSGIQVDNYFTGSGAQGITQNISFNDSGDNEHLLNFEDGLLVNYTKIIPPEPSSLLNGLVSYYKLDEASGAVIDSVGSYNLTNNGSARGVAGKINNAFDFESSENDFLIFPSGSLPGSYFDDDFTINMWINVESKLANSYFFWAGTRDINIFINYIGDLYFQLYDGTPNGVFMDSANYSTGTWHMLTAVRDKSLGMKLYLNGDLKMENSFTGNANSGGQSESYMGDRHGPEVNYDGLMDEPGFWNRALSSTEISELYNSGNGLTYPFN